MTTLVSVAALVLIAAAPDLPRRFAVVVGSNAPAPGRQRLRFAHRDAQEMAEVLIRTGEFPPSQVTLLLDPTPGAVLDALDASLSDASRVPQEALLLFYYSGHADTQALYPDSDPLSLALVRQRLESAKATVRVGIVDACRGGGWTQAKGVARDAPFEVRSPLELRSEGSALLSSSAGMESAHESELLGGSFFTHHLVAGLRGAADRNGDGEVTLGEAFAYARELTIRDSSLQAGDPQHPSYQMNLRGRSDLPLARVAASDTAMELRQSEGPLQVVQLTTGLIVLELPHGTRAVKVAVPPGRYLVRSRGSEGLRAREVSVEANLSVIVAEESLELVAYKLSPSSNKGDASGSVHEALSVSKQPGWNFEARLDTPLYFQLPRVTDYIEATVNASLTYYFKKLIDDLDHPLGLLVFLQHPDSISIQPSVRWSSQRGIGSNFGGILALAVYPWERTGFVVGLAGTNDRESSSLGLDLGIHHYLSSALRLEAFFSAHRAQWNPRAPSSTDSEQYFTAYGTPPVINENAGALGVTAIWADEKMSTQFLLSFRRFRYAGPSLIGTEVGGKLNNEFFLNRRISIGMALELSTASYDRAQSSSRGWQARVGPFLNAYLSDNLLLSAIYTPVFELYRGSVSAPPGQVLGLSVGWRF